jgi:hypothetical protein
VCQLEIPFALNPSASSGQAEPQRGEVERPAARRFDFVRFANYACPELAERLSANGFLKISNLELVHK